MTEMMSRLNATSARERLETAGSRMSAITMGLRDATMEARSHRDENLSPEGLGARRQEMVQAARERASRAVRDLRAEVDRDITVVRSWAELHTPRVPDDAVGLQRLGMAWDRARMQLDAGRSIREVLATADRDVALAVREWGPDWLRAHNASIRPVGLDGAAWPEPDTTGLVRSCDRRLAETVGGLSAAAIESLQAVEVARAGLEPMMRHAELEVMGANTDPTSLMSAALESRFAAQQASAGFAGAEVAS
ncbi:MAG: hypothetical protein L0H96_20325 [Humibacillus sp.]|nr:hypothetical protein [Humibacillus sp.]MDN5779243.1 hypothetical protein [Humibacillus sp.]